MVRRTLFVCLLMLSLNVFAQQKQDSPGSGASLSSAANPDSLTLAVTLDVSQFDYSTSAATKLAVDATAQNPDATILDQRIDWNSVARQSFFFLGIQHGVRMNQHKTRRELDGKFWQDYFASASHLHTWGDTDGIFTNYVAHPMQGGLTGFLFIQNDPKGIRQEFGLKNKNYWNSRLKAMGWSAVYSTQFELGLVSEAAIGNVGQRGHTMGYVDLVMTPVGGFGLIVLEDALDKHWVQKLEARTAGLGKRRFYRAAFNPQRTIANLLRFKKPWHRDTRAIDYNLPEPNTR